MLWFAADLHFGDEAVISYCKRPFSTMEEMNETLRKNWNDRVSDTDDIYIIGDLIYGLPRGEVVPLLESLKGRKHLITGNHDHSWMGRLDASKYFVEIADLKMLKHEGRTLVLCHYPMLSWPGMHHRSYCVFGHVHNTVDDGPWWSYIRNNDHMLNAGVDICSFRPVSLDELKEANIRFKEAH